MHFPVFRTGCPHFGRLLAVPFLIATAIPAPSAQAAVPRTISIQGVLQSPGSSHTPKPDGTYTVAFRLYDAPTGGTLLWSEPALPVTVSGGHGLFAATLGAPTAFGALAFDQPYYLEAQVSGDPPMTPRLALGAAPYSLSPGGGGNLSLPFAGSAAIAGPALSIKNTGAGNGAYFESAGGGIGGAALAVHSASPGGIGALLDTSSTDGNLVLFQNGTGDIIKGFVASGTNLAFVVHNDGQVVTGGGLSATRATGTAVAGVSNGLSNLFISEGVFGASNVGGGYGVYGTATTGNNSVGVRGDGGSNGVEGHTSNNTASGVYGQNVGAGYGVAGRSKTGPGVLGDSTSDGLGTGGDGVEGAAHVPGKSGVYGHNEAPGANGVLGISTGAGSTGVTGIAGGSSSSKGIYGVANAGYGVYGIANDANGTGVYGENTASGSYGWLGSHFSYFDVFAQKSIDTPIGVYASGGPNGAGLLALGTPNYVAAYFSGQVKVEGSLFATDKHFLIDHPLDPANKLLVHTSVESPDALDVYNGNAITDESGTAIVTLPDYFEALNKDFRYQLTCIGQFAQAIVAEEIRGNRFTIRTDRPNVKVSWQVAGIRNDAWARAHPAPVEVEKPAAERGRYIQPEAFGKPPSLGMGAGALGSSFEPARSPNRLAHAASSP